jgi:hypothetical protein
MEKTKAIMIYLITSDFNWLLPFVVPMYSSWQLAYRPLFCAFPIVSQSIAGLEC